MFEYRGEVVRVIDGDTMELEIDLGFGIKKRDKFRLLGIDTPEIFSHKASDAEKVHGREAKAFVEDELFEPVGENVSRDLIVKTHKDKAGKYGRFLAEIIYRKDEEDSGVLNLAGRLKTFGFEKRVEY